MLALRGAGLSFEAQWTLAVACEIELNCWGAAAGGRNSEQTADSRKSRAKPLIQGSPQRNRVQGLALKRSPSRNPESFKFNPASAASPSSNEAGNTNLPQKAWRRVQGSGFPEPCITYLLGFLELICLYASLTKQVLQGSGIRNYKGLGAQHWEFRLQEEQELRVWQG